MLGYYHFIAGPAPPERRSPTSILSLLSSYHSGMPRDRAEGQGQTNSEDQARQDETD